MILFRFLLACDLLLKLGLLHVFGIFIALKPVLNIFHSAVIAFSHFRQLSAIFLVFAFLMIALCFLGFSVETCQQVSGLLTGVVIDDLQLLK